jgi:hypothetical protein
MGRLGTISKDPVLRTKIKKIWFLDSRLTHFSRDELSEYFEQRNGDKVSEGFLNQMSNKWCRITNNQHRMVERSLQELLNEIMLRFKEAGVVLDIRFVNSDFSCDLLRGVFGDPVSCYHAFADGQAEHDYIKSFQVRTPLMDAAYIRGYG